jgi:hypothetical protein
VLLSHRLLLAHSLLEDAHLVCCHSPPRPRVEVVQRETTSHSALRKSMADPPVAVNTADPPKTTEPPKQVLLSVCQRCKERFDASSRDPKGCVYHPQSWCGETAQRWLPPGSNANGAEVHFFWTCCGHASSDAPGCRRAAHVTFDEPDDLTW